MEPEKDLLGAKLGDARRVTRGAKIVATLAQRPERSLPEAFGDGSSLDLAYRWLSNEHVDWTAIRSAHAQATWLRAKQHKRVLAVHDTTEMKFPRRNGRLREHLSAINTYTQGFYLHTSAIIAPLHHEQLLGVVSLRPYVHATDVSGRPETETFWREQGGLLDNESIRWWEAVELVQKSSPAGLDIIHVGDRETDDYALYANMMNMGYRFVMRSFRERLLADSKTTARATNLTALAKTKWSKTTRTISISAHSAARSPKDMEAHPAREPRRVTLSFRSCTAKIARPNNIPLSSKLPAFVTVNLVEVFERKPPKGEAPVRWIIVTNEPVAKVSDLLAVVDIYCCRWIIEELFKCLKSGCLIQSAQLDSSAALLRLLAVMMPVATYLMNLRHMQRQHPDKPATIILDADEIAVLQQQHPECFNNSECNIAQVVSAIAKLGGHLSRNGLPGFLTLARGTNALYFLVQGWRLAHRSSG
jgi:hypothetical protein